MVGFGWRGLGFSGFGQGGDQWSGWSFLLERSGFFWVWSGWSFLLERARFSRFYQGGDRWSFLYCLVDRDLDWASTRWIQCC